MHGKRTGWICVPFHKRRWHRSVQAAREIFSILSICYGLYTECAQSRGPENNGLQRACSVTVARTPVQSHLRITLENNGKIRPQPDRENAFAGASGGGGGIRTHGTLSRTPVFKTGAFDHSATPPTRDPITGDH